MSKLKPVRARDLFNEMRREDSLMAEAERRLGSKLVLARNLLRLRVQRGLTQTALAKAAGLSQPRIAEIEAARSNPQLDTLDRIASALGVQLESLLKAKHAVRHGKVTRSIHLMPESPRNAGWEDAECVTETIEIAKRFGERSTVTKRISQELAEFNG